MNKILLNFSTSEWFTEKLEEFKKQHKDLEGNKAIVEGYILFLLDTIKTLECQKSNGSIQSSNLTRETEKRPIEAPIPLESIPNQNIGSTENITSSQVSNNLPKASTAISENSKDGLPNPILLLSKTLEEKLEYQRQKALIWTQAKIKAEQGKQIVQEQVRRFRKVENNTRGKVDWESRSSDCGVPNFYDYEENA